MDEKLEVIILDSFFKATVTLNYLNVISGFKSFPSVETAEPRKRVLIEGPVPEESFDIDFYSKGKSPGFSINGLQAQKDQSDNIIILYKAVKNVIRKIWIIPDDGHFTEQEKATCEDFKKTGLFTNLLKLLHEEFNTPATLTFHYNNYDSSSDELGLGAVSNNTTSWTQEL